MSAYAALPAGVKCRDCKDQLVKLIPPPTMLVAQPAPAYVCPTCDRWGKMRSG